MERENQLFFRQVRALWPEVLQWLQTRPSLAGGCWVLAAGVRGTFAVDEEAPVDLPLSSLLFIVIASYLTRCTRLFRTKHPTCQPNRDTRWKSYKSKKRTPDQTGRQKSWCSTYGHWRLRWTMFKTPCETSLWGRCGRQERRTNIAPARKGRGKAIVFSCVIIPFCYEGPSFSYFHPYLNNTFCAKMYVFP